MLKMKIDVESMQIWTFDIFRNFYILLVYFHNFMVYPQFFHFKMQDGHLMPLITYTNTSTCNCHCQENLYKIRRSKRQTV